jgi:ABC-type nickel/cobalt efflux system permease component RcnA
MGDYAMWILILLGLWLAIVLFRKWKEEKELDQWFHEHQHDRRIERYKDDTEEKPDKKEHSVFSTDLADMCCDPTNVYFQNIYNQD